MLTGLLVYYYTPCNILTIEKPIRLRLVRDFYNKTSYSQRCYRLCSIFVLLDALCNVMNGKHLEQLNGTNIRLQKLSREVHYS